MGPTQGFWDALGVALVILALFAGGALLEIADQLPSGIGDEPLSLFKPDDKSWDASYSVKTSGVHNAETMAEALALLWLKLAEKA